MYAIRSYYGTDWLKCPNLAEKAPMISWANYHSHTQYCDGATLPEAYVEEAIRQGFVAYGFSGHASVPFATEWCIPDARLSYNFV